MESTQLYAKEFFPFFLLLARMGGLFLTVPGFGENYIPPQIRLLCALTISIVLAPALQDKLIAFPTSTFALIFIVLVEVFIGVFTGLALKVFFGALHFAGGVIGFHVGLMNAFINDPNFGQQNSIPGVFLTITATFLIFATGIHHHILQAVIQSYHVAPPNDLPSLVEFLGDMSKTMTGAMSASIRLATQLAGPFILLGLILYAGLGVINRLMPQIPVFFVIQPLIIFLGFVVMCLVVPTIFTLFMDRFDQFILALWAPK